MDEFLTVIDAAEAHRRFRAALNLAPVGEETVIDSLGRVLAVDVKAPVDVPGFDRSNVDGFAVRAEDTFGATEATPKKLTGTRIVTGGVIPRGYDTVAMIEDVQLALSERSESKGLSQPNEARGITTTRALTPGQNVSFAGSDIAKGEIVLRAGTLLTARETGTLAAIGVKEVRVWRKPEVAVFSTGNELVPPGGPIGVGQVYDSNLRIIGDTLREMGCEPVEFGIVKDDLEALRRALAVAVQHDAVILSGGTSKGEVDLSVRAVREVATVVAHGVALKPGKPLCLAACERKPVVVLPGFPTSAVFTFHEFVAPVLRAMCGLPPAVETTVRARMPVRVNTEKGRAEFLLVSLSGDVAWPMGKGSGSVTAFARADGFVTLARQQEFVDAGEVVEVRLLGRDVRPADLIAIGSHCVGLDFLLSMLRREGFTSKALIVGSQGGFLAAERGECDIAGVHLCDEKGVYNTPFLKPGMSLVRGYARMQGVVFRDREPDLVKSQMVNRNRGSGTRGVIDELLKGAKPPGHHFEAKSHNAVAAAVAQSRADWGVAIKPVADLYGLKFRALREERYDFVVPESRAKRPAVVAFKRILESDEAKQGLAALGFAP